jgi:CHAD domain-containing protein
MTYEFGADEPVGTAFVRCAHEQLDRAIDELSTGVDDEPARAVHDARKAMKKTRSLLRLVRGATPRRQRRHANAALRAAGRDLAHTRDSDVLGATLAALSDRFAGQLPATTFAALREHFGSRTDGHDARIAARRSQVAALEELRGLRLDVDRSRFGGDGWKAIESGLVRSYTQGRKAFRRARSGGSLEDLHEWRKRVKDLWYQERLLTAACGQAVRGHSKDAHLLADLLGDDHDLGLLREQLTDREVPVPVDVDAVITLVDYRREELQNEAVRVGARVYAEKPKAFKRRMRRSFEASRASASAPYEQRPVELAIATRTAHH